MPTCFATGAKNQVAGVKYVTVCQQSRETIRSKPRYGGGQPGYSVNNPGTSPMQYCVTLAYHTQLRL